MKHKTILKELNNIIHDNNVSSGEQHTIINQPKILTTKYKFDKPIKLTGKYLTKYNNIIKYNDLVEHYAKLYTSGFYEYQFKLKQYLSEYGINRLVYNNSSTLHLLINNIILSSNIRGRFIQLLISYGIDNNFLKMIDMINSNSYELIKTIDTDEKNIFNHIITILYKVLCKEGIRNTDQPINMTLTNLAINMRVLNDKAIKSNDPKEIQSKLLTNFDVSMNELIRIFNKYIDTTDEIISNKHINKLTITLMEKNLFIMHFKNNKVSDVNVIIDSVNYTPATGKYKIETMKNIHFVHLYYSFIYDTLQDELLFNINNKEILYKLDTAILVIVFIHNNYKYNIYLNCFICNGHYFVYDIFYNLYFKIDWRKRDIKNYYHVFTGLCLDSVESIYHTNIVYYNTQFNYTYDSKKCMPKRSTSYPQNFYIVK